MAVFDSEDIIINMKPDFEAAARLPGMGAAVTAPGREYDCVSRFFAPKVHIPEDPVTGSLSAAERCCLRSLISCRSRNFCNRREKWVRI